MASCLKAVKHYIILPDIDLCYGTFQGPIWKGFESASSSSIQHLEPFCFHPWIELMTSISRGELKTVLSAIK